MKVHVNGDDYSIVFRYSEENVQKSETHIITRFTTTCRIKKNGEEVCSGSASKFHKDKMSKHTGRSIALSRALLNCLPGFQNKVNRTHIWSAYLNHHKLA
jgi:hypothetical protein